MKTKIVNLFTIALFFFSSGFKSFSNETKLCDYEIYSNQIIAAFAKETEEEFGLICIGSGGQMPYDVERLSIRFTAYRKASIQEARDLEVKLTERFLKKINSSEKIRPYLREYPFRPKRAVVSISFNKPNNALYDDGSVAYVFQAKNMIYYCTQDPSSKKLIDLLEEPYEEALKVVNSGQEKNNPNDEVKITPDKTKASEQKTHSPERL